MSFVNWLFGRVPAVETPAPDLPEILLYAELQAHLDQATDDEFDDGEFDDDDLDDDDLDDLFANLDAATLLEIAKIEFEPSPPPAPKKPAKRNRPDRTDLEPVYTVIDYRDASGQETRRRITMLSLYPGPKAPMLTATCHERKAYRSFRCDRIQWFLEPDGEAIRPDNFFRDTMGIDLADIPVTTPANARPSRKAPPPELDTARKIREKLRPTLSILIAAARADDELHAEELDVIYCFAEDAAIEMAAAGRLPAHPTIEVLNHLNRSIAKMRPQGHTVASHLKKVLNLPQADYQRFAAALDAVIDADGHVALGEELFLADLAQLRARVLAQ